MQATVAAGPRDGAAAVVRSWLAAAGEGLAATVWRPEPRSRVWPPGPAGWVLLACYLGFGAWAILLAQNWLQVHVAHHPGDAAGRTLAHLTLALHAASVVLAAWRPVLGLRVLLLAFALGSTAVPEYLTFAAAPDLFWSTPVLAAVLAVVGIARPVWVAVIGAAVATVVMVAAGVPGATILGTLVPVVVTTTLASRSRARRELAEALGRTAAAEAHGAVLAERARIAREMHDVVAHHMSMIVVRCETAPYRLGELPDAARAELTGVGAAARQALTEMQALLGVLRSADQPAEHAPQPGIAELDGVLREARDAGTPVTWSIGVDPVSAAVPPAVGLSVHRVVQQALSNAGQHAPGAPVRVDVSCSDNEVLVEVVNGRGTREGSPGGGQGLIGMRERVEVHQGTLHAGPTPDGGFAVRAEIPVVRR